MKPPRILLTILTVCALIFVSGRIGYATHGVFQWSRVGYEANFSPELKLFLIEVVVPNTPASKAGLRAGDAILAVADEPVTGFSQYVSRFQDAQRTRRLDLRIKTVSGEFKSVSLDLPPPQVEVFSYRFFFYAISLLISALCTGIGLAICWLRWEDATARLGGLFFISVAVLFSMNHTTIPPRTLPFFMFYTETAYWFSGYWCFAFFSEFPSRSAFAGEWRWVRRFYLATVLAVMPIGLVSLLTYLYSFEASAQFGLLTQNFYTKFVALVPVLGYLAAPLTGMFRGVLDPDQNRRYRVLLGGIVVGCGPLLTLILVSLVKFGEINLSQFPLWVLAVAVSLFTLFPISFAYTVIKHRVLGVKQILRRGLQYAFVSNGYLVIEVLLLFFLVRYPATAIARFVFDAFHYAPPEMVWRGMYYLLGAFGLFVMWSVNPQLQAVIDRAFFRDSYQAQQVLSDLSRAVRQLTGAETILPNVAEHINRTLHVNHIAFLIRAPLTEQTHPNVRETAFRCFECRFQNGKPDIVESKLNLPHSSLVVKQLLQDPTPQEVYYNEADAWTEKIIRKDKNNPFADIVEQYQAERRLFQTLNSNLLVPLATKDEILGFLSLGPKLSEEGYTREDKDLLTAIAEATSLRLENSQLIKRLTDEAGLKRELEIARTMQQSLLPATNPQVEGFEFAAFSTAANEVGGDYYDYFQVDSTRTALAVGDVTGHGVSSGLLMALAKGGLLNQVTIDASPQAVMFAMNNLICATGGKRNLMTFAYGVLDGASRRLEVSNAGHPHPFRYKAACGQVEALEASAYPLGVRKNSNFPILSVELEPGDAVVFYSDGIVEAQNVAGRLFGFDQLAETIAQHGDKDAAGLRDAILDTVRTFLDATRTTFTNAKMLDDDMTLLVVRMKSAGD